MLKERISFLKLTSLLLPFVFLISYATIFLPLVNTFNIVISSLKLVWILLTISFLLVMLGCLRARILYLGYSLISGIIIISSSIYVVRAIMIKPPSIEEAGTFIGFDFPFNYIAISLYSVTLIWIIYKQICEGLKNLNLSDKDIDYKNGLIFYDKSNSEQSSPNPKKHSVSILLIAVTQVFLVKMSWTSTTAGVITLTALSLVAIVSLILLTRLFLTYLNIRHLEKERGISFRPALRQPFKLRQALKDSQKNSY